MFRRGRHVQFWTIGYRVYRYRCTGICCILGSTLILSWFRYLGIVIRHCIHQRVCCTVFVLLVHVPCWNALWSTTTRFNTHNISIVRTKVSRNCRAIDLDGTMNYTILDRHRVRIRCDESVCPFRLRSQFRTYCIRSSSRFCHCRVRGPVYINHADGSDWNYRLHR